MSRFSPSDQPFRVGSFGHNFSKLVDSKFVGSGIWLLASVASPGFDEWPEKALAKGKLPRLEGEVPEVGEAVPWCQRVVEVTKSRTVSPIGATKRSEAEELEVDCCQFWQMSRKLHVTFFSVGSTFQGWFLRTQFQQIGGFEVCWKRNLAPGLGGFAWFR
jgi:hypothetical protein